MFNNKVTSLLMHGKNKTEHLLFKCAIHYAEAGMQVWFISSQPFHQLPADISQPDKEILKLITFLYLKCDDLISHLSGIHMWNKPPQVIIVSKFEEYCNSTKQNFDVHIAAQISAMLLDAASTCAKKYGDKELLLVACNRWHSSVQTLVDLYYENIICCDGNDCDAVFEEIKQILK